MKVLAASVQYTDIILRKGQYPIALRVSVQQKEKLQRLGGAPWVRKKIDQAKE